MRFREQAQKIQQTTETVLPGNASDDKQTVKVQQQSNWSDVITSNLGGVAEVLLMISFIPFLVYFMLSWQDHVRAATVMLFKMENRNTAYVTLGRISAMIHSFINGNLAVGIFTSIISLIVFGALHLPYFYFLGFISGFLSLVPYLGVVLALIPPVVAGIGVLHGGGMIAIIVTVLGVHVFALKIIFDNVESLRPYGAWLGE